MRLHDGPVVLRNVMFVDFFVLKGGGGGGGGGSRVCSSQQA